MKEIYTILFKEYIFISDSSRHPAFDMSKNIANYSFDDYQIFKNFEFKNVFDFQTYTTSLTQDDKFIKKVINNFELDREKRILTSLNKVYANEYGFVKTDSEELLKSRKEYLKEKLSNYSIHLLNEKNKNFLKVSDVIAPYCIDEMYEDKARPYVIVYSDIINIKNPVDESMANINVDIKINAAFSKTPLIQNYVDLTTYKLCKTLEGEK